MEQVTTGWMFRLIYDWLLVNDDEDNNNDDNNNDNNDDNNDDNNVLWEASELLRLICNS